MSAVNWTVIRNSTLVGLLIIVPLAVLSTLLIDDAPGWTAWLFLLVGVLGFAAAGWAAGRARRDTPVLHGSISAAATYLIVQLLGVIARVAGGSSIDPIAIVLSAVLALSCGVAGALVADWLIRRRLAAASV